jgi:hypothetical protein
VIFLAWPWPKAPPETPTAIPTAVFPSTARQNATTPAQPLTPVIKPPQLAPAPSISPPPTRPDDNLEPFKRALAGRLQRLLSDDPSFQRRLEEAAQAQREQETQAAPDESVAQAITPMLQDSLKRFFDQPSVDVKAARLASAARAAASRYALGLTPHSLADSIKL